MKCFGNNLLLIASAGMPPSPGGAGGGVVARDAYGFSLNYFTNDYAPIGNTNQFAGITIANNLFNGNIKAMMVNIPKLGEALTYSYQYDQLNRLTAMDAWKGLNNATNVFTATGIIDYKERISYDPNGNIKTYLRNGDAARSGMDNLTYYYKPNTNQLDKVADAALDAAGSEYDKYNDIKKGQVNGNYQYDAIGNLTSDASEGITAITWNVYGKIKSITKAGGINISYGYDASGNRISKDVNGKQTWYVRDAGCNVMSVYTKDAAINSNHLTQIETHLYGSSRLGIENINLDVEQPAPSGIITFTRGKKFFELSNHLGNVLATISDKKLQHTTDGSQIDYYKADVISANDYYPGGMDMPGRTFNAGNYAYGFNGKRMDNEVSGVGNQYDYGFRIYDPRIVRFKSTDPLTRKYPYYSPYQFAGNSPIKFVDLDGLEPAKPDQLDYSGKTTYVDKPYQWTGGDTKYGSSPATTTLGSYAPNVDMNKFIRNSFRKDRTFVNTNSQFLLKNENAFKDEHDLVNHLLGDFIWGKGPENIVFPHNGKFSSALKNSTAVGYALLKWARDGFQKSSTYLWGDNLGGEIEMTSKGGLTSLEHFLGSVNVRITKTDAEKVNIEVFNVTSMTSGYLPKAIPIVRSFVTTPTSTVRNSGGHQLTYSNTSQYFSFDISTSEAEKLINSQQGEAGKKYAIK